MFFMNTSGCRHLSSCYEKHQLCSVNYINLLLFSFGDIYNFLNVHSSMYFVNPAECTDMWYVSRVVMRCPRFGQPHLFTMITKLQQTVNSNPMHCYNLFILFTQNMILKLNRKKSNFVHENSCDWMETYMKKFMENIKRYLTTDNKY